MPRINRIRNSQLIREAEGYLELDMPDDAMRALERVREPGTFNGQLLYLKGEALRAANRYAEAIEPLAAAADLAPSNVHIWLALGWCYKRAGAIELAVEALEEAQQVAPDNALVNYNLACYHSLAGTKHQALAHLSRAIALDAQYRDLVDRESDFDPIRSDPEFQAIVSVIV